MHRTFKVAALLIATVGVSACSGQKAPPASSTNTDEMKGKFGVYYYVNVSRPVGGTIRSTDGKINCGTLNGPNNACEAAQYGWTEKAELSAIPDQGQAFVTWAADCSSNAPDGCTLDTTTSSAADKWVAAVFNQTGKVGHGNIASPSLHGPMFFSFVEKNPAAPLCTTCHGTDYQGISIAPSCTACHAQAGHGDWLTDCTFCHGAPPATASHASVAPGDLTRCSGCHPDTVTGAGTIVAGGKHMDGQVESSSSHPTGFSAASQHGPEFLKYVSATPGADDCKSCHGADYAGGTGPSCNECHGRVASGSWVSWQTNCTFCHGTRTAVYDGASLALSAPPDAVQQRLSGTPQPLRTGKHTAHAGSACSTCHAVPSDLSHIGGATSRATVTTSTTLLGYDTTSSTCTTYCHGAATPVWDSAAASMDCSSCHGAPPATASHGSVAPGDLTRCSGCHPESVTGTGTILPGGKHLDGQLQYVLSPHAAGFAAASLHGPEFLKYVSATPGADDCKSCHGADYAGGTGPSCNECHGRTASGGWVNWQTNCTFCHGTRKATYGGSDLALAAPPDAVQERLTGTPQPLRTGKHTAHATSTCNTCHVVPTDLTHIGGASARATVTLAGYDLATSTCTTACHGTATQTWSTSAPSLSCTDCHETPPQTGKSGGPWVNSADNMHDGHVWDAPEWGDYVGNVAGRWDSGYEAVEVCVDCHASSVNPDGTIRAFGTHTNGIQGDVAFGAGLGGSATVTPSQVTCATACHGSENWY